LVIDVCVAAYLWARVVGNGEKNKILRTQKIGVGVKKIVLVL
jgi:hypothetical protein